jgi:hypothetical protein
VQGLLTFASAVGVHTDLAFVISAICNFYRLHWLHFGDFDIFASASVRNTCPIVGFIGAFEFYSCIGIYFGLRFCGWAYHPVFTTFLQFISIQFSILISFRFPGVRDTCAFVFAFGCN